MMLGSAAGNPDAVWNSKKGEAAEARAAGKVGGAARQAKAPNARLNENGVRL